MWYRKCNWKLEKREEERVFWRSRGLVCILMRVQNLEGGRGVVYCIERYVDDFYRFQCGKLVFFLWRNFNILEIFQVDVIICVRYFIEDWKEISYLSFFVNMVQSILREVIFISLYGFLLIELEFFFFILVVLLECLIFSGVWFIVLWFFFKRFWQFY